MTGLMKCQWCLNNVEIQLLLLTNTTIRCPKCGRENKITVSTWRPASPPRQPSREALAKVAA